MTALAPPFSYYGGKTTIAPWIVSLMPRHRIYTEAFAGGLSVLLAKPRSTFEIVNDLDDDIVNFWRVLRDRHEELERVCALTPYARAEHAACAIGTDEHLACSDVERARRFWSRCHQAFSRRVHDSGWSTGIDGRGSVNRAMALIRSVGRFAPIADRLAAVVIEHRDAFDVLRQYDAPDAVHYVDPPYVLDTRWGGRHRYRHDMTTDQQHDLAAVLNSLAGTVMLSGYPSELYDDLYGDWHTYTTYGRAGARWTDSGGGRITTEVIWSNCDLGGQRALWEFTA